MFNDYDAIKINELSLFLRVLINDGRNFDPNNPLRKVHFKIGDRINPIKYSFTNDGMPSPITVPIYNFNYKTWFEKLEEYGILKLDKKPYSFKDWLVTANLQSLLNFQNEVNRRLFNTAKQVSESNEEVLIRDALNNNRTLKYPCINGSIILPKNINSLRREKIGNFECDVVIRDKMSKIKMIVEITVGSINLSDIKKAKERRTVAPKAILWFIGARINQEILNDILKLPQVHVTLIKQLKESYPKVFNNIRM